MAEVDTKLNGQSCTMMQVVHMESARRIDEEDPQILHQNIKNLHTTVGTVYPIEHRRHFRLFDRLEDLNDGS